MNVGDLVVAKGNRMPFIIISKVKMPSLGRPWIEIDGYKVARCDRINHPFVVDEEDFAARFEVVA